MSGPRHMLYALKSLNANRKLFANRKLLKKRKLPNTEEFTRKMDT